MGRWTAENQGWTMILSYTMYLLIKHWYTK